MSNSDIRTLLLAALGLGEWEAEHLTGVDLARQVVERVKWLTEQLEARSAQAQRLAIDVQELQSGEAWGQLREQLAEIEGENRRLRGLVTRETASTGGPSPMVLDGED